MITERAVAHARHERAVQSGNLYLSDLGANLSTPRAPRARRVAVVPAAEQVDSESAVRVASYVMPQYGEQGYRD
jgi:hypothetical protein